MSSLPQDDSIRTDSPSLHIANGYRILVAPDRERRVLLGYCVFSTRSRFVVIVVIVWGPR
jgi:hypothetical protein